MSYEEVKRRLGAAEIIVLDGATGTELQRRGVAMDPVAWCGPSSLGNDALLMQIHADYIHAGSDVITANTFASSRLMLSGAGLGQRVAEINTRAVEAALRARDKSAKPVAVAGSLSHMVPVGAGTIVVDREAVPSDAEVGDALSELALILKSAGVDLIILEMMYNPGRARLAVEAALATGLPVWFGLSARRTQLGEIISYDRLADYPLADILDVIPATGVDVAGVMHTQPDLIAEAVRQLRTRFGGPLMAYPDSGYFEMPNWRFVDTIDPEPLRQFFSAWIASGVQVIGGCCGLGVEHIEAAVAARSLASATSADGD